MVFIRRSRCGLGSVLVAATVLLAVASGTCPGFVTVHGGPTYDPVTGTGFDGGSPPWHGAGDVNDSGQAVGTSDKWVSGVRKWERAIRWDAAGNPMELNTIWTDAGDTTRGIARSINDAGLAVGYVRKNVSGVAYGNRALRWDAAGNPTELGNLGTRTDGWTHTEGSAINNAGVAVGYATKYVSGSGKGNRAVRWDAVGNATEMGVLGTSSQGKTDASANDINELGLAVGSAKQYVSGVYKGSRAVRWDAAGNVTELGNLGTSADGYTMATARDINEGGLAIGFARKYVSGTWLGYRTVLWDTAGNTIELDNLGTGSNGYTEAWPAAINNAGLSVGYADKYVSGIKMDRHAVRWDAAGNITELATLGWGATDADDINEAGFVVGHASTGTEWHAVCWRPDGSIIDLNDLIDPGSGWTLNSAEAISDTGWIAGSGQFDPDGSGPLDAYGRVFIMLIPEPATLSILALAGVVLVRRRR